MKFKRLNLLDEYRLMPKKLSEMTELFESISMRFDIEPVVTRIMETIKGSSGVHEAGRAIDFRDEHAGVSLYTEDQREILLNEINAKYTRSDGRMTLIWHSFNGAPHHFHLQQAIEEKHG